MKNHQCPLLSLEPTQTASKSRSAAVTSRIRAVVSFLPQARETPSYLEGQNVAIEYRFAEDRRRQSGLAADLVERQVAVTVGNLSAEHFQEVP
jgi:hypothetical protein